MDRRENAAAQAEALKHDDSTMSSWERARLWAGLNRYLEAEAEHAVKAEKKAEKKAEPKGDEKSE
jgi:hypothetical protein